jgi:hypothetical protein
MKEKLLFRGNLILLYYCQNKLTWTNKNRFGNFKIKIANQTGCSLVKEEMIHWINVTRQLYCARLKQS